MNENIDDLVANKVMNVKYLDEMLFKVELSDGSKYSSFRPSTELLHAWKVVDKLQQYGDFALYKDYDSGEWEAELGVSDDEIYSALDEKVNMVICKLALKVFNK